MRIRPFALALLLTLGAAACASAVRYRPGATIEVHDVDML